MLVLSRRIGERIVITANGQEIWVALTAINGNQATIGIDAPDDVTIHREEIHNRIQNGEVR